MADTKKHAATAGKTIGIDLGTTFSAVAVMEGGKPVIIPSAEGERTVPSVVSISEDGEHLVGRVARNQAITNPEHTVRSIKRHMGEEFEVTIWGKSYSPQEISAMILQKLKRDAEAYLGYAVKDAVITVPAYFTDSQRQATKDAGRIAGLNVQRIINEPTAASLAYGLDKADAHTILVFDFGGGTFDVSILELGDGVFEVKATAGDNRLGGDDIDELIVDWLATDFKKQHGVDLREDKQAHQRLIEAAEKAKIELSSKTKTAINLPFITATQAGPKHVNAELTRAKFEQLIERILDRLKQPVVQAMKDAGLGKDQIDKVIFVGGSTRIPAVQQLVKDIIGKDGDKSVNPDEAVALGAAIQAGVLGGEVKDVLLLDVTPLSLGIETLGGVFTKLIERNTTIPTEKSQVFSTAADNQNAVTIKAYQGERAMAADNKPLGQFDLVGIPPAPRGVPQIEVAFDIDANGIVSVKAKDLGTGKTQSIKITSSTNLSKEEIERMRKEAQQNEKEDERRRKEVDAVNEADALVYGSEKLFSEFKGKVGAGTLEAAKKEVDALKSLLEAEPKDADAIRAQLEKANGALQQASQELYAKVGQQGHAHAGGQHDGGPEGQDGEQVVDAQFEDVEKEQDAKKDGAAKGKRRK